MIWRHREPTLEDILSDPIVTALMEADGVDRQELEAMLKETGRRSTALSKVNRWPAWPGSCRPAAVQSHDAYTGQVSSRKAESQNIHSS
jgi:hypothetical protein